MLSFLRIFFILVHPLVAYIKAIIDNLPEKTGRLIDQWISLIKESGPVGEKEHREWLKKEFKLGKSLGKDVKVCPCKSIVPLYRKHVFAEIKPSTRARIDLGLALKNSNKKPLKRLIDSGGKAKGDRITHRFTITSKEEIDDKVKQWLRIAYELDD